MLQSEELDRESYEEIRKRGMGLLQGVSPDWNDYNASDPGVTIVELMAWFTQQQQYHLSRIGEEQHLRYLKLLGTAPKAVQPAHAYLTIKGKGTLPEGTRFYADEIPFETAYAISATENTILGVSTGERTCSDSTGLFSDFRGNFQIAPFGEKERFDDFTIYLKDKPEENAVLSFYFAVKPWKHAAPITEDFLPFTTLRLRLGKADCTVLLDETKGFCKSGVLCFQVTGDAVADQEGRYALTISTESRAYPSTPILSGILPDTVLAFQKETHRGVTKEMVETMSQEALQEDFLGSAYGICKFRLPFPMQAVIPHSIALYVKEAEGVFRWDCVEDFDAADAYSRVFRYDRKTGELVFGDGFRGMPPEGEIYLMECVSCLGSGGNVNAGMIGTSPGDAPFSAINFLPSTGGMAAETIEDCFARVQREQNESERCVTLGDYEAAVRRTPGVPVKQVKAFSRAGAENCICIVVELDSQTEQGSAGCLKNLKKALLPKTLIGTKLEFLSPEYVPVHLYVQIGTNPYYTDCHRMTEEAIRRFFDSGAIPFGATIGKTKLSRYITGLAWVKALKSLDISVSGGSGRILNNGDIKLENHCLPQVEQIVLSISEG
jgi:hypothetical protein